MHADFCVDALKEAIKIYGPPEIMNTDQGSQFTGSDWITTLTDAKVRIRLDHHTHGRKGSDQHGWPGPIPGQYFHRTLVALAQI